MKRIGESTHRNFLALLIVSSFLAFAEHSAGASLLARLGPGSAPVPPLDTLAQPGAAPVAPAVAAYAEGLELIEIGRFLDAVPPLSRAVDAEEENAEYLLARGVARLLAERVAEGRTDLERAYRLQPKNDDVRRMLAFALRLQGGQLNAPKYYSHGSTDPYDQFLLKTGNDYGALLFGSRVSSPDRQMEMQQRRQAALAQFPQIGRMFARRHKQGQGIGGALFARGVQRYKAGQFAAAEQDFTAMLEEHPDDITARYYHAASLIRLNRLEQGRSEMSTVLSWKPALVEGYADRAMAAARMGDLSRAERDLEIAAQLDAKDTRKSLAAAQRVLADAKAKQPALTPASLDFHGGVFA